MAAPGASRPGRAGDRVTILRVLRADGTLPGHGPHRGSDEPQPEMRLLSMATDQSRVIVTTGATAHTTSVHHRDFPEIRAEGETPTIAARHLANQLTGPSTAP